MAHRCYACDPANPRHIVSARAGAYGVRVPARFVGPPGHANGGIAVGALACPALLDAGARGIAHPAVTRIAARLQRSVALDAPFAATVAADEAGADVALVDDAGPLINAHIEIAALASAPRGGDPLPAAPRPDDAAPLAGMAEVRADGRPTFYEELGEHRVTGCFSCGPDHPDGLHVYPRFTARDTTCATWPASHEYEGHDGAIALPIVIAALDCSSGVCLPLDVQRELLAEGKYFLLGSLDVRFLRVPAAGRGYRVVARALGRDGRKLYGLSALFDDGGTLYATADTIWIVTTLPAAATA